LKNSSKIIVKKSSKLFEKNLQKLLKNYQKIQQKKLPGLAKKKFIQIKLKICANLFSIKIKKKLFFFGTW
jgi:hypothetical protein